MKNLLFILFCFFCLYGQAQDLKFDDSGKFKIVQFTDVHFMIDNEASLSSIAMMNKVLDTEKPNLVVFSGDIVTSKDIKKAWDTVLDVVISRNIPYVVTLGNHDDEGLWTRTQIAEYLVTKNGIVNNIATINKVDGVLNSAICINNGKNENAAILYVMDSNAYSTLAQVKGYGWFSSSQINWYKEESIKLKKSNMDTLPALAFFHIPLPEYSIAFNDLRHKRIGVRYEAECSRAINSGMYAAMLESGDVMGVFVGHDHVNDYLVDYYDIALAYGCFSGSATTYQRAKNGARIIVLLENERKFETYIREYDDNIIYRTNFPF